MFSTGCRPSEALGLEWTHIKSDRIRFEQALSVSTSGLTISKGLKTQSRRDFPINNKLKILLENIPKKGNLVFPSPKGGFISFHNYSQRAWDKTLEKAGIERKNPYQTRHTFITLALQNGLTPQDVAKLVGTSPKMIFEHYAGVSRIIEVPEF